jgi:alcohol dehydrogenase class IV
MAFNNASLGYVHAMAHQLGGVYDLPHGVCNALLLPHVEAFNVQTSAARLSDVAAAMGSTPADSPPKPVPRPAWWPSASWLPTSASRPA